jgi:DNA-binding XRE family transcriptional regulator
MAFTLADLGANIRLIRKSRPSLKRPGRPLYQKELAESAGIPASCLCNIENGRYRNPTWEILGKIARALDCDVSEFFQKADRTASPSEIALAEVIDLIVKERLEALLGRRK